MPYNTPDNTPHDRQATLTEWTPTSDGETIMTQTRITLRWKHDRLLAQHADDTAARSPGGHHFAVAHRIQSRLDLKYYRYTLLGDDGRQYVIKLDAVEDITP